MSPDTAAELADLVNEWLRVDQVRMDNVLTWWLGTKLASTRILALSGKFRSYGLQEIVRN